MLSVWTKQIKGDTLATERFQQTVRSAKPVLERLHAIMLEEISRLDRSETNPATYDTASWSHLQAHKNGFRQYHQLLEKLIDLDQKDI
jgi:transcriptional regulator with GAF, ATPase, and Fis domain